MIARKPFCQSRHQRYMLMTMTHPNDAAPPSLSGLENAVIRVKAGDTRAFETIYRETLGVVYGLCLRMTSNPSQADECTQRTYIKAWQKIDQFQGKSRLTTWLHRIAVNEVLGLFRSEKRFVSAEEYVESGFVDMVGEDLDLEQAISQLTIGQRQVFVLFGVYGYSHDEVASMLGIAVGTSKAQLHRARAALKETIEKGGDCG